MASILWMHEKSTPYGLESTLTATKIHIKFVDHSTLRGASLRPDILTLYNILTSECCLKYVRQATVVYTFKSFTILFLLLLLIKKVVNHWEIKH